MIHNAFIPFISHLARLATRLAAEPAFIRSRVAFAAVALALSLSGFRLHGAPLFDRGPSEREIRFTIADLGLAGLVNFVQNQGDFVRENPDGTYWLHGFASDAVMYLGIPNSDEWDSLEEITVLFTGNGRFTWFDLVTYDVETGMIQFTEQRSDINAQFILTSTGEAEAFGIPAGTPFQFRTQIVLRDGEPQLYNIVFKPLE